MSNSLWPHGLQHAWLPCLSPTPGACSNSCPLSWWCHPTISSSIVSFFCLQFFPASESFQMSQFFISCGQIIGVSASTSVRPMNIQDWFPFSLDQFSHSVVPNSLWPHDCSTPGLPIHYQLPEFTQTHVHWLGDAIQPCNPLSSPSPAFNPSQHQGFFQWVNSLHEVSKYWSLASVLPKHTEDWSPLEWTSWISL